jgi:hypothetical protein
VWQDDAEEQVPGRTRLSPVPRSIEDCAPLNQLTYDVRRHAEVEPQYKAAWTSLIAYAVNCAI